VINWQASDNMYLLYFTTSSFVR